ncbi:hypothetical protein L1987_51772 [Smallanthus sonchifolius]|uniref:Uncharacterized protein n=1 Tax=Smallanthus sonchifolius TaxID=185202 RepID=A0ACB9ES10_9ASTR|nr:hypothetical protein L1987_51772 [Smallanthus sonchifolius]
MRIIKAKSVQAFKPDPYVTTILNCAVWMFYSLPIVHPNSLFWSSRSTGLDSSLKLSSSQSFGHRLQHSHVCSSIDSHAFANSIVWCVYALMPLDPYIFVPNGLGSLSATLQLILYATYYGSTNWDDDDEQGEVQMSSTSKP